MSTSFYYNQDQSSRANPVDQEHFMSAQFAYQPELYTFSQQPLPSKIPHSQYYQNSSVDLTSGVPRDWRSTQADIMNSFETPELDDACFPDYGLGLNSSACITCYPVPWSDVLVEHNRIARDLYQTSPFGTPSCDIWSQDPMRVNFNFCLQIPESISSSPTEDSISPRSARKTEDFESLCKTNPSNDEEGISLQALGLYDCPDLTMDDADAASDPDYSSPGKGLKLEETFVLDDECLGYQDDYESYQQPLFQVLNKPTPWS